jgi:hypothetical protein
MPEKPVLLICGCKKYEPYLHAAIQRFKLSAWTTIGVVGDPTLAEPAYDKKTNIVTLPVSDIYERLPAKIYAAIAWVMKTFPEVPGIYKTDDDILYGDIRQVATIIDARPDIPFWGLKTHVCEAAPVNMYRISARFEDTTLRPNHAAAHYCYGHGYWVNRTAIKHILAAKDEYEAAPLEDVCTGSVLNRAGIEPVCIPIPYAEVDRTPKLLNFK